MGRNKTTIAQRVVSARPERPSWATVTSESPIVDLSQPSHSYLFGFLNGDGTLGKNTRNRGRLSVELSSCDEIILKAFRNMLPVYSSVIPRQRDTNFKDGHRASVWTVPNFQFRTELSALGLPTGKKSKRVKVPTSSFQVADFYRGLIDADGSLGFTGVGDPFISLCTSSSFIANGYQNLIRQITGVGRNTQPNARDDAYNIMVQKELAQLLADYLYYDGCLALPRKHEKAVRVIAWSRPEGSRSKYSPELLSRAKSIPSRVPYCLAQSLCFELSQKDHKLPRPGSQGFWTDELLLGELQEFCKGMMVWPSTSVFQKAGRTDLLSAVANRGGMVVWSERLRLPRTRRYASEWTREEDKAVLTETVPRAAHILNISRNVVRARREILLHR